MRFAEIFKTELFSKFKQKAGCYISKIYDDMKILADQVYKIADGRIERKGTEL